MCNLPAGWSRGTARREENAGWGYRSRTETPGPPTNPSPTTEQGLIGLQKTNRIKLFLNTHRDAP